MDQHILMDISKNIGHLTSSVNELKSDHKEHRIETKEAFQTASLMRDNLADQVKVVSKAVAELQEKQISNQAVIDEYTAIKKRGVTMLITAAIGGGGITAGTQAFGDAILGFIRSWLKV